MSKSNKSSDKSFNDDSSASNAESDKTNQAAQQRTTEIASVMAPEKILRDEPPEPNYPLYRVEPGKRIILSDLDPNETEEYEKDKHVEQELQHLHQRLANLQARLYAEQKRSLLIVLQATDTGGKDGTIKHVFRGVNPQGCRVWSFKQPSAEELEHDFLWRYHRRVPQQGTITIFNRSHYEDVLVVRVKQLVPEEVWRPRYHLINEFEHMLTLNNIAIIKFFLHISKDEQKQRLESRLKNPDKLWKFSLNDLKERRYWSDYQAAYEDMLNNCSTAYAPWYVVPANKKWYRNLVVARTIVDTLAAMNPQYPAPETDLKDVVVPD